MKRFLVYAFLTILILVNRAPAGDSPFLAEKMVVARGAAAGASFAELANGALFCVWVSSTDGGTTILGSKLDKGGSEWTAPSLLIKDADIKAKPVISTDGSGVIRIIYRADGDGKVKGLSGKIKTVSSKDEGNTWSRPVTIHDEVGYSTAGKMLQLDSGNILLPVYDKRDWSSAILLSQDGGKTWKMSAKINTGLGLEKGNIEPVLMDAGNNTVICLMQPGEGQYKTWKSISTDGGLTWQTPVAIEVPSAHSSLDLLRLKNNNVVMVLNPIPGKPARELSIWLSTDLGQSWNVSRRIENGSENGLAPQMILSSSGMIEMIYSFAEGIKHLSFNESWVWEHALVSKPYKLPNLVPKLDDPDDMARMSHASQYIPVKTEPFIEHVRGNVSADETELITPLLNKEVNLNGLAFYPEITREDAITRLDTDRQTWIGTKKGLYTANPGDGQARLHQDYGIGGPLASHITALAIDSKETIWVGTPIGLSGRKADGTWFSLRGKDGLPYEDITALAVDKDDRLWIGTSRGAILYKPYAEGRQWFYRAGKRYLVNDQISAIHISEQGMPVYFKTAEGISRLDGIERTLAQRADIIESLVNQRHRRLGMVAACVLDDAENPTSHTIGDSDNDGLWTSYHVVAMSLAYGATGDPAYRESAKTGMHALIMLQNASGIPGLVARSVVPASERNTKSEQWRWTPDKKLLWKSDTSSDEIDGHYFGLFAYWQHVAQFDPEENALIRKQVSDLTDYIVDNGYLLIDWTGERTRWGFWNPKLLNDDPEHYIENGLNAAQMLSFLKVAFHITGNLKYKEHYDTLISEHGYLGNVLLEKKVFPDEYNHSDNQLGYCALYPILQLEHDPDARLALQKAVRRHYKTIANDGSSFFFFASATIDPDFVDIKMALTDLVQTPTDRRLWRMENSHRADITWSPQDSRFGRKQLLYMLPGDERCWEKWNGNPYYPDAGPGGRVEDDGASWLLGYWMGRYHGFITE